MVVGSITLLIASLVIYILLKSKSTILADAYLFILFIFAFLLTDKTFSMFYLMVFMIAIVLDLAVNTIDANKGNGSTSLGSYKVSGFQQTLLFVGIGVVMYGIILTMGSFAGGKILGAPNLQVTSVAQLAQASKPTFEASLGIIENRVAFVFFLLLDATGHLIPFLGWLFRVFIIALPMVLIGLLMGLFHVVAYGINAGLIVWAAFAFMLFIASYFIFKNSLPADISHYINNATVSLSRQLAIAI